MKFLRRKKRVGALKVPISKFKRKLNYGIKAAFSNQHLKNGILWVIKAIIIVVGAKLFLDVGARIKDKRYHLVNFEIPDQLKRSGYNGDLLAKLVLQGINDIESGSNSFVSMGIIPIPKTNFDVDIADRTEELNYSGVSYRGLVNFLSNIFSSKKYITGNMTISEPHSRLRLSLTSSDNKIFSITYSTDSLELDANIHLMTMYAANDIYISVNPLQYAQYKLNVQDYRKCISIIDQNFASFSRPAHIVYAYWLKSSCLQAIGKFQQSIDVLKEALLISGKSVYAYLNIITNFLSLKQFDSAKYYMEVSEKQHVYRKALNELNLVNGIYYKLIQKFDSAVYFFKAVRGHWTAEYALKELGLIFANKEQYDSASYYFNLYSVTFPDRKYFLDEFSESLGPFPNKDSVEAFELRISKLHDYKYGFFAAAYYYFFRSGSGVNEERAEHFVKKALEIDSTFIDAHWLYAKILDNRGDHVGVNEQYAKAQSYSKYCNLILLDWASYQLSEGDVYLALSKLDTVSYMDNSDRSVFLGLMAEVFKDCKDLKSAELYYRMGALVRSENVYNLVNLAKLKYEQGDFLQSSFYCEKVLELDSFNNKVLKILGLCKLNLDSLSDIDFITQRLDRIHERFTSNLLQAEQEFKLDNLEDAMILYEKAYRERPYDSTVLFRLATYLTSEGKYDSALVFWGKYEVSGFSLSSNDYNNYGDCYLNKEKYWFAIFKFETALEIDPSNCTALRNWAFCLLKLHQNPYVDLEFMNYRGSGIGCDIDKWISESKRNGD